jgi:hypothetical protein
MALNNTVTYSTVFDDKLQDRLDHPTTWKAMCDVMTTNDRVFSTSYMSTTPTTQAVTRGTAAISQTFVETAQTLTISTGRDLGLYLDLADEAQSPWSKPAELFDRIGALLNEYVETDVLAQHASWTDFDNASIGGAAGPITVSATNIDNIILGIKREIREANGQMLANQNGIGIVWRQSDYELLESFMISTGFQSADQALRSGVSFESVMYLGVQHMNSNEHAAGHVFAAVKKIQMLGILKATYGRAYVIPFPGADTSANNGQSFFSGTAYYSRIEIGHLTPAAHAGLTFDVLVN